MILTGYSAAAGADLALDQVTGRNVPNEATGLAVLMSAEYAPVVSGRQMRHVQLGAGAYSALAFADRIGIRDTIEGAL